MSEKLNIYKEKLENSIEIQIGHLIKQRFSDLTILSVIIIFFSSILLIGLAGLGHSAPIIGFCSTIFIVSALFLILFSLSCYEFDILSNKEVLEVLDKSEAYEINEIIVNKYKEQGCIYKIQKELVNKYIKEQKEIELEKEIENKVNS